MIRKLKFGILLALFTASCMTANEKTTCDESTKTVHDTITVTKKGYSSDS
jgi:hypothetical protein